MPGEEGEGGGTRRPLEISSSYWRLSDERTDSGNFPRRWPGQKERGRSCCCLLWDDEQTEGFTHPENGKDLPVKVPQHPVNGTCIAGEVVAQCGRRGILVVRLAGAQGSWPGSAWTTKLLLGTGLNVLAGTWRGDSCPTMTHTRQAPPRLSLGFILCSEGVDKIESRSMACLCRQPVHRRLSVD